MILIYLERLGKVVTQRWGQEFLHDLNGAEKPNLGWRTLSAAEAERPLDVITAMYPYRL